MVLIDIFVTATSAVAPDITLIEPLLRYQSSTTYLHTFIDGLFIHFTLLYI